MARPLLLRGISPLVVIMMDILENQKNDRNLFIIKIYLQFVYSIYLTLYNIFCFVFL